MSSLLQIDTPYLCHIDLKISSLTAVTYCRLELQPVVTKIPKCVLTSNKNDVLLSGVGESFLVQNINYHCPTYCILKFDKPKLKPFSRHIWLFHRSNYESPSQEISNTNWNMLKNDDINIYANNLTEQVIKSSKLHIPNKFIKVRQSDPHWMNNNIKQMMRKRKRLYDKYNRTKNVSDLQNFKQYRNKITGGGGEYENLNRLKLIN